MINNTYYLYQSPIPHFSLLHAKTSKSLQYASFMEFGRRDASCKQEEMRVVCRWRTDVVVASRRREVVVMDSDWCWLCAARSSEIEREGRWDLGESEGRVCGFWYGWERVDYGGEAEYGYEEFRGVVQTGKWRWQWIWVLQRVKGFQFQVQGFF